MECFVHKIYERYSCEDDKCSLCGDWISEREFRLGLVDMTTRLTYKCKQCPELQWHPSCVPSPPESINHPCHPIHPLDLHPQGPPNYSDLKCSLCQQELSGVTYHCKLCDFSVDMSCAKNPQPLTVDHPKCHDHALTCMGRQVSFTCNACGTHGEGSPYVCLPCSRMFHYDCLDRPHVININRHDHRISHACPLPPGGRICEICRKDINWRYGAYSCNRCPDFFVHTKCATSKDVWDGVELDGVPEEEVDIAPYKVIDEGIINHFSHEEHNLLLIEDVIIDGGGEIIYCEGCSRPISFERYYKCMECVFMLHEECANLPLQKRHAFSTSILYLTPTTTDDGADGTFDCSACSRPSMGFRYHDGDSYIELDVHCASLSWFRHRKLHRHTLFLTTLDEGKCVGCDKSKTDVLNCVECDYSLDFKCATLPAVVKHRCDDHYLFLSSGEKATGKYWCEICEAETDPQKWFYTCHDCGVVCHIDCVIGDSLNVKPGLVLVNKKMGTKVEAVLNNKMTRPRCFSCPSRCMGPMIYKTSSTRGWGNRNINGCTLRCAFKNSNYA